MDRYTALILDPDRVSRRGEEVRRTATALRGQFNPDAPLILKADGVSGWPQE
jgi:hypothetical protein